MKKKVIIDTDTAADDAVALIMAINNPNVQIEAITVVAGNVSLNQGVQNALYTISLCQSSHTVYPGMSKPIVRQLDTAENVHGKDGLGDIGLPLFGFKPSDQHAVEIIIEKINQQPNEVTLICLAPLTNIATALLIDSSIASKLKECIIMGGVGKGRGNVTPISEFNFWADPEAAKVVFESGIPIKMVGWDISRKFAVFDNVEAARLKALGTPLAKFAIDIQKKLIEYTKQITHLKGFDLPDPIAMAIAIDETVATRTKRAFVTILTNDDFSRGQAVIDFIGSTGNKPNAEIVLKANSQKFIKMLHESLVVNID